MLKRLKQFDEWAYSKTIDIIRPFVSMWYHIAEKHFKLVFLFLMTWLIILLVLIGTA